MKTFAEHLYWYGAVVCFLLLWKKVSIWAAILLFWLSWSYPMYLIVDRALS